GSEGRRLRETGGRGQDLHPTRRQATQLELPAAVDDVAGRQHDLAQRTGRAHYDHGEGRHRPTLSVDGTARDDATLRELERDRARTRFDSGLLSGGIAAVRSRKRVTASVEARQREAALFVGRGLRDGMERGRGDG